MNIVEQVKEKMLSEFSRGEDDFSHLKITFDLHHYADFMSEIHSRDIILCVDESNKYRFMGARIYFHGMQKEPFKIEHLDA